MAIPFSITPQPVRVTSTGFQPIYLATEVRMFDQIEAVFGLSRLEGTGSPSVTVELWTGMQKEVDDGWLQAVAFSSANTIDSWQKVVAGVTPSTGLLRYVRWNVTALTGSSPAATFFISAIGRVY